jgi:hypothetical protein
MWDDYEFEVADCSGFEASPPAAGRLYISFRYIYKVRKTRLEIICNMACQISDVVDSLQICRAAFII